MKSRQRFEKHFYRTTALFEKKKVAFQEKTVKNSRDSKHLPV